MIFAGKFFQILEESVRMIQKMKLLEKSMKDFCSNSGVEIRKLSLSVSSLISIFGLTSVRKIVLNQYKLSILALFTFKFLNFQWVNSTELKMISVSKLTKENKIYYNQVRMIGSSISFLIFVGYSEWKWVKIGPICIFWK